MGYWLEGGDWWWGRLVGEGMEDGVLLEGADWRGGGGGVGRRGRLTGEELEGGVLAGGKRQVVGETAGRRGGGTGGVGD